MVKAPKKNFSPPPEGKYGKSTTKSTCRRHQVNKGRPAWRSTGSEHWEHCAASDLQRRLPQRTDRNRTFWAMKRNRNGSRMLCRERPLCQESKFLTQRQRLCEIWWLLQTWAQQPESPIQSLKRYWMLSETVWAILPVTMICRIGRTRKMMKIIQSSASSVMMMNLDGWWTQSIERYSTAWSVFGRSRWDLTNWPNWDGGTLRTTFVREIRSMGLPKWRFRWLSSPKSTQLLPHHPQKQLENICRLLRLSEDNWKGRQWLLYQEAVEWGWVRENDSHINSYLFFRPARPMIQCQFMMQILSNP